MARHRGGKSGKRHWRRKHLRHGGKISNKQSEKVIKAKRNAALVAA